MSSFETIDYFTDPSLIDDPFPYFEYLRTKGPVTPLPNHGVVAVTGYDEAVEVLRDPGTFSSCNSVTGPFPGLPTPPEGDDISELIEVVEVVLTDNGIRPQHKAKNTEKQQSL